MANTNFYNDLNLSSPEIAIALEDIDRAVPNKMYKFCIPVLTPDMSYSSEVTKKVVQNKSNIVNENKDNIKIDNLDISNAIMLSVPAHLLAIGFEECNISGSIEIGSPITGPVSGSLSILESSVSGYLSIRDSNPHPINGHVKLKPVQNIIKKGSKWIVVFIAGDINKIKIIGRYE